MMNGLENYLVRGRGGGGKRHGWEEGRVSKETPRKEGNFRVRRGKKLWCGEGRRRKLPQSPAKSCCPSPLPPAPAAAAAAAGHAAALAALSFALCLASSCFEFFVSKRGRG